MQCPKCFGETDELVDGVTSIRRCQDCSGIYFHQLTRGILESLRGSAELEDDRQNINPQYDAMVYVDCPKCNGIMDQRLIEEPNRIRFELCPSCNSAFLDAGEFSLYTKEEYLEDFMSLLPDT